VIEEVESIPVEAATVIVTLKDATVATASVPYARGSIKRPLGDRELDAKLRDLASAHLARSQIDHLLDAIWSLDRLDDAATPIRLSSASTPES